MRWFTKYLAALFMWAGFAAPGTAQEAAGELSKRLQLANLENDIASQRAQVELIRRFLDSGPEGLSVSLDSIGQRIETIQQALEASRAEAGVDEKRANDLMLMLYLSERKRTIAAWPADSPGTLAAQWMIQRQKKLGLSRRSRARSGIRRRQQDLAGLEAQRLRQQYLLKLEKTDRGKIEQDLVKEEEALAAMLARAETLRGEIRRLMATAPPPPPPDSESAAGWRKPDAAVGSPPSPSSVVGRLPRPLGGYPGIDLTAAEGALIHAVGEGTVIFAEVFPGFGQLVIIEHSEIETSHYANLGKIRVKGGQAVASGDAIGSAGWLTDQNHFGVHFEYRLDGESVDPLNFLNIADINRAILGQ